jgi:hypothetical protein
MSSPPDPVLGAMESFERLDSYSVTLTSREVDGGGAAVGAAEGGGGGGWESGGGTSELIRYY